MLGNDQLDPVFAAVVQATEESVINALVAAETMTGQSGHRAVALPPDRLREVLKRYNRLALPAGAAPPSAAPKPPGLNPDTQTRIILPLFE